MLYNIFVSNEREKWLLDKVSMVVYPVAWLDFICSCYPMYIIIYLIVT